MADNLYRKVTQILAVVIGKCLCRSDYDTFTCMYSEGVEVLHIADRDTVVITVAHHFILNFLPSFERFLNKDLRREREGFACDFLKLSLVVAET